MTTTFLGIDVSHQKLDIAYFETGVWHYQRIENDWSVIEKQVQELANQTDKSFHAIVEATGTYSTKLVYALCQARIALTLLNPVQSSAFATMKHRTTKNDRSDAKLLAEYGQTNAPNLPIYQLPNAEQTQIHQLLGTCEQLIKLRQQVRNQRHAYVQLPPKQQQKTILDIYDQNETQFDTQIDQIQSEINKISPTEEGSDKDKELITTIKGIGDKTATILMAKTNGIKKFQSAKQLAKFIGIAPTQKQSGSSVKSRGRINRTGNASLRKALYCASWSAIRFNLPCKELYKRLRSKGKPVKLALIAVCNLLCRQIFAVVNSQLPFDNQYYLKFLTQTAD